MWLRRRYDSCEYVDEYRVDYGSDQPYGLLVAQSSNRRPGAIRHAGVALDECDFVHRLRSLERIGDKQRLAIDRAAERNVQICVDLHRSRRQRRSNGYGFRRQQHGRGAHGHYQLQPKHHRKRRQHDDHLVVYQCNLMHGLRCVVRDGAGQRRA